MDLQPSSGHSEASAGCFGFDLLWNADLLGSSLGDSELVPTDKQSLVLRLICSLRDEGLLFVPRSRGQKVT